MMRLVNLIFVLLFFGVLFAGSVMPLMLWGAGVERNFSDTENRKLFTFSDISKQKGKSFREITSSIEKSASDQLLLRDPIVRGFRRMQVHGFGQETSETVIIGRNGHWYQTGNKVLSRMPCASPNPVVPKLQDAFTKSIIDFDRWLRSEGKTLSLIIVPLQHSLEPSNLPLELSERCQLPFEPLQTSVENLREAGIDMLYDPHWIRETGVDKFYDPKAFHWNPEGALRYIRHGFETGAFPTASLTLAPFNGNTHVKETDVDIARYIGVAPIVQKYNEPVILQRLTYQRHVGSAVKEGLLPKKIRANYLGNGPSLYAETDNFNNGRGLIIGDSFSQAPFNFLARQFTSTLSATSNSAKQDPGRFRTLVNDFQPDHVFLIFEESKFTPVKGGPTWLSIGKMMGPNE